MAIIRLFLAVVLFLAALLTVVPAQSYFLWEASIAVNELGHWLAVIGVLLLLPGGMRGVGKASAILAAVSTILLLLPVLQASLLARNLPVRVASAFGAAQPASLPGADPRTKPLSFLTLFRKPPAPEVRRTTLTYITRDGKPLELEVYKRDRALPPAPLVIAIHGGSWRSGTRADLPALNYYLASRGYVVATPSYRFAPESPYPAASQDIDAAISFLKANARQFGIDSTKIVLLGRSAGAQIALLAGYTRNDKSIRGVVSLYGPTDQKWGWDNPSNRRVYNSAETLRAFLNGDPNSAAEAYRASSPLNFVGPKTPPTLMIHGTQDPLVSSRQSLRLDSALVATKRPHLFIDLPWATHGCDYVFNGPCGQISTYAIERFVAAVTK
ncbi:MAG: alpha/beta hydrolase [Gemmatimonadaceae bacterium]